MAASEGTAYKLPQRHGRGEPPIPEDQSCAVHGVRAGTAGVGAARLTSTVCIPVYSLLRHTSVEKTNAAVRPSSKGYCGEKEKRTH